MRYCWFETRGWGYVSPYATQPKKGGHLFIIKKIYTKNVLGIPTFGVENVVRTKRERIET